MGNGMLFVPFLVFGSHASHTSFLADLNLLNFVFVFLMAGWTTTSHRVASAAIARSPFSECLKSQSACAIVNLGLHFKQARLRR